MRAATIKAVEPCELLKVEREQYNVILKTLMSDELQEKVDFLRQVSLFRECGDNHLQSIAYVLGARSYKRGEVVVMQGQPSEEMYFVCSGSARVIMALEVPLFDAEPLRLSGEGGAGPPTRSRSAHELRGGGGGGREGGRTPGSGRGRPKSAPGLAQGGRVGGRGRG